MKYRAIKLNCEYLLGDYYVECAIQVKKWYGWVTIHYVEGEASFVNNKVERILHELEYD